MATEENAQKEIPPAQDSKPMDTEKCLSDFFNNAVLSDMSLINPSTKATTR